MPTALLANREGRDQPLSGRTLRATPWPFIL
jgi:hypothetical protein